ncbi:MAG: hypothetical protein GX661_03825 [Acholeplasmataceae bacterium]|nr:hypothetical protein [Acholeplasmataceae bacterium]
MGVINLSRKIFTPSWLNNIISEELVHKKDLHDFLCYYQVIPKVKKYIYTKSLVLVCIVAKSENFDFYSDEVDKEIQKIYETDNDAKRSRKHIVLQFKKYQTYTEAAKEEIDKIINFKVGRDYLVHITVGYFVDQNTIYFLRPKKKYPNKYYYYASKKIQEYCGLIE